MKKLLFSFLLLLAACHLMAQQSVSLGGTISKTSEEKVMLFIPNPLLPTLAGNNLSAILKEDGSFSMRIELVRPMLANFRHGRQFIPVYLQPGKDISLLLNAEGFESLRYEGAGSAANNFLAAYFRKFMGDQFYEKMKSLDGAAFSAMQLSGKQRNRHY